jgi:uncharacterized Tic20 family protein
MNIIIKIAILFCFFYLFLSPILTSTIALGEEVKLSCYDVRSEEAEKYPHVIYCGQSLKDDGPGDNYVSFVYVSGATGWNFNLKSKGVLDGERPIKSDSYTIESFYTSEDGKPVASFESGITDQILVNHDGSFLIRGPKDNLKLEAEGSQADYVKTVPVEDCIQLVYSQLVMDAYQKGKFAENLSISIRGFERMLTSLPNSMINSLRPNMFSDPNIYTDLMQLGGQDVEGMRMALASGHELVDTVFIPTEPVGTGETGFTVPDEGWRVIDSLVQRALDEGLDLVPIHNHPETYIKISISIREGFTYDGASIPSINVDPNDPLHGDWIFFAVLRRHIQEKSAQLSGNSRFITIKYEGILNRPTEDSTPTFNVYEFGENPDPSKLVLQKGAQDQFGNPVYRPSSILSAGYWKRLWTKIDGERRSYFYVTPPQPELYDLALPYEMDFYNNEISTLGADLAQIIKDVAIDHKKNFDDVSNELNDLLKWVTKFRTYLDDSGLSESTRLTWQQALNKIQTAIETGIRERLNLDNNDFKKASLDMASYITGAHSGQTRATQDLFRNIEETLHANGIDPPEDFVRDAEKYASESSNNAVDMGRLFNSNTHDQRAGQVLDNYVQVPQELTDPLGTAMGKVAAIIGFIPGFLIVFGPGLASWAANHNDYAMYELGISMINYGLQISITVAITYSLLFVSQALQVGLTMAWGILSPFLAITVEFFIVGAIIGAIAVILLFIFFQPPHYPCETDSPWYTGGWTGVEKNITRSGDTLHYIYYGVRYCYPTSDYMAILFYSNTPNPYSEYPDREYYPVDSNKYPDITFYCETLDGRCLDCSVNVKNPIAGKQVYLGASLYQLKEGLQPPPDFLLPKPLFICPGGDSKVPGTSFGIDESEIKCALCNDTYHAEVKGCYPYDSFNTNNLGICAPLSTSETSCTSNSLCYWNDGKCESSCGASPECDEIFPNTSWSDGDNIKKTCNSICQYSKEFCKTGTEDTDYLIDYTVKGTCTQYLGYSNGECKVAPYVIANTPNTDHCACVPKCSYEQYKNGEDCSLSLAGICYGYGLDNCKNDQRCTPGLFEYFVDGSVCSFSWKNCTEIDSGYTCVDGRCDICKGDLNGDKVVSLSDLVIFAQAYGSKPGDPKWNPNADIAGSKLGGPDGQVRLSDLVIIAQHYGFHCW